MLVEEPGKGRAEDYTPVRLDGEGFRPGDVIAARLELAGGALAARPVERSAA